MTTAERFLLHEGRRRPPTGAKRRMLGRARLGLGASGQFMLMMGFSDGDAAVFGIFTAVFSVFFST